MSISNNDVIDLVDSDSDDDNLQPITPQPRRPIAKNERDAIVSISSTPESDVPQADNTNPAPASIPTLPAPNSSAFTPSHHADTPILSLLDDDDFDTSPAAASNSIPNSVSNGDDGDDSGTDEELREALRQNPLPTHYATTASTTTLRQRHISSAQPSSSHSVLADEAVSSPNPSYRSTAAAACSPSSSSAAQLISSAQVNQSSEKELAAHRGEDDEGNVVGSDDESVSGPTHLGSGEGMEISNSFARELATLSMNFSNATEEAPTPPSLSIPLLRHQKQALAWMARREADSGQPVGHPRGGILADDQGFGKTLSFLALMAKNTPSDTTQAWGNLVVAPTSILRQWAAEIQDRFDVGFQPSVLIYHGHKRAKEPAAIAGYDIVITSYGILAQEYPREDKVITGSGPTRRVTIRRRSPGTLYRVRWHRVVLDEAQAIKNRLSESHRAASALHARCRWAATGTPIQNTVDDLYSILLFLRYFFVNSYTEWRKRFKTPLEGTRRNASRERAFARFQAIVGPVLLRRAKHDRIDGKPVIPLPERNVRILELDFTRTEREHYSQQEVMAVRRMETVVRKAMESRTSAMAGALLVLLRLRQACSHPKLCNWESDELFKFSDDELDAAEVRMEGRSALSYFSEEVRQRIERDLAPGATSDITCPICMDVILTEGVYTRCGHVFCTNDFQEWARSHDLCPSCRAPLGGEPQFISVNSVRMEIHAAERKKKREAEKSAKAEANGDEVEGGKAKDEILEEDEEDYKPNPIAMRLLGMKRPSDSQSPPKGHQAKRGRTASAGPSNAGSSSGTNGPARNTRKRRRGSMSQNVTDNVEEERDKTGLGIGTSTKIKAFITEYKAILETGDDKVLCFSQWTRMLDLVEDELDKHGFEYTRLDGQMDTEDRADAVRLFQTRTKCRLMLVSLKAGSTGLNLTAANRVFLLDSWWNPAVEDQAIDRVHRIGQKKDVHVVKFKITNTVEDRILALQEKKRIIADAALGKEGLRALGRRRLTMRDVLELFTDVYRNVADRAQQQQDSAVTEIVSTLQEQLRNYSGLE